MRILLGIDGSQYSLAATRFICDHLAQPGRQVDTVHVLPLVVQPGGHSPRRQPETLRIPARTRSWLDRAEKRLRSFGVRITRHVQRGLPARVVPELAARGTYDLVVVGAKGRSDIPFLPAGSVALAVLEQDLSADVLLVRERKVPEEEEEEAIVQRPFIVLFPTDGSARVQAAAQTFFRMFSAPDIRPIAVAVAELPEPAALAAMEVEDREGLLHRLGDAAGHWAREAKPLLARPGIQPEARALRGSPAAAIVEEARRSDADLIVLGSRGAASPAAGPLGSVALQVARLAPCSVLIMREH